MNEIRIYALLETDPAYKNGARYATVKPAWTEWVKEKAELSVVPAWAKWASIEDARLAAQTGNGVYSTKPGCCEFDSTWILK